MKPQVKSEAEASLIILAADQESAIWFIGWKGLRETAWGTKYEIKEFWRARRCCIRAKVRLSRYEILAGPHTLLKAAHTPGSIQRIKLFQDAVTCNPVDQCFLSVGLKLWHQEYSNSCEQTSAPAHSQTLKPLLYTIYTWTDLSQRYASCCPCKPWASPEMPLLCFTCKRAQ